MITEDLDALLGKVCESFGFSKPVSWEHLKDGNINQTYRVDTESAKGKRSYILQKLNSAAFKTPWKNIENHTQITNHLRQKLKGDPDMNRKSVKLYTNAAGSYLYTDAKGDHWRAMSYIYGAVSVNKPNRLIMRRAGEAFGAFAAALSDFPPERLHETIPDFHNTEKRMEALVSSAKKDSFQRFAEVSEMYDYFLSLSHYASFFRKAYDDGKIKLRVTHNDTKCNNVMFDKNTFLPLAIIDLDTVMPGFTAHDFGDAVRFGANTAEEDETDLSKVRLDIEMFKAFARGFIPKVKETSLDYELKTLPCGVLSITLECGARFLTDYLEGDKYFITKKPKHNYYRARCQAALLKDAVLKLADMEAAVAEICEETAKAAENEP